MEDKNEQLENELDVLTKKFDEFLLEISSYVDTAHLFISKYDKKTGNTHTYEFGEGHFQARYGQIRQWLIKVENNLFESDDIAE